MISINRPAVLKKRQASRNGAVMGHNKQELRISFSLGFQIMFKIRVVGKFILARLSDPGNRIKEPKNPAVARFLVLRIFLVVGGR